MMSKKSNQWMDFLPEFRARLRKMYVISSLELAGILLAVCGILGGLGFVLECKRWIPGIFVAGGIGVLLIFCISRYEKKKPKLAPYQLRMENFTMEKLQERLNLEPVGDDGFYGRCQEDGVTYRLTVVTDECYGGDISAKRKRINAAFNRKYHPPHEIPMSEQSKRLRINMVVLSTADEKLEKWVAGNTEMLLTRGEGILNVGVLMNEGILLIPALNTAPSLAELQKYQRMVKLVVGIARE